MTAIVIQYPLSLIGGVSRDVPLSFTIHVDWHACMNRTCTYWRPNWRGQTSGTSLSSTMMSRAQAEETSFAIMRTLMYTKTKKNLVVSFMCPADTWLCVFSPVNFVYFYATCAIWEHFRVSQHIVVVHTSQRANAIPKI